MKPVSPVFAERLPEVIFAKDQPEYIALPAVRIEGDEGEIITRWRLGLLERLDVRATVAARAADHDAASGRRPVRRRHPHDRR